VDGGAGGALPAEMQCDVTRDIWKELAIPVYQFARAAITKCHILGCLNNRNVFVPSSGSWKSSIKVLAGLISGETFLPGFQIAVFSLCPSLLFLCVHIFLVSLPLLIRTPVLLD